MTFTNLAEQRCLECGSLDDIHHHHIIPKSLGGTSTVPLCQKCHGVIHGIDLSNHGNLVKAALQAAKARGVKLGNPRLDLVRNTDTTAARAALVSRAKTRNDELRQVISEIKGDTDNELTLREIAKRLNDAGYTTSRGGRFHPTSVNRIISGD